MKCFFWQSLNSWVLSSRGWAASPCLEQSNEYRASDQAGSDMLWLVSSIPHSASDMPGWFPIHHGQCATQAAARRGKSPWGDHSYSVEKLSELSKMQPEIFSQSKSAKQMCFQQSLADLWPWPPICTFYSCRVFVNVRWCSMAVPRWKMDAATCYSLQVVLAKKIKSFLKESCNQALLASHPTRSAGILDRRG